MEHRPNCKFRNKFFPFASNKVSPFNSQNTLFQKCITILFFVSHIGRMDDIWASYYVLSMGFKVIYGKAIISKKGTSMI